MKITKKIAAVLGALAIGCAAFALDGRTVMQNADNVEKPKFTRAQVQMILIEKSGASETRVIDEWGKNENGLSTMVMQFNSPA
ncbi:MAG: outer membrane lipoprotein-sorting protein, partial [Treponemataceae bacterium]|nr:outer membrane lipoprotein-sorting protein [Treponemataceae bacterium]